jgi:hypothetical protein
MEREKDINEFVREHTVTSEKEGVKTFRFSPGNGSSYGIFTSKIGNGFLVVNDLNGRSHKFEGNGLLTAGEVSSALYTMEDKFDPDEIQIITSLIGYALGRETTIKRFNGTLKDIETAPPVLVPT